MLQAGAGAKGRVVYRTLHGGDLGAVSCQRQGVESSRLGQHPGVHIQASLTFTLLFSSSSLPAFYQACELLKGRAEFTCKPFRPARLFGSSTLQILANRGLNATAPFSPQKHFLLFTRGSLDPTLAPAAPARMGTASLSTLGVFPHMSRTVSSLGEVQVSAGEAM